LFFLLVSIRPLRLGMAGFFFGLVDFIP
jgi:hypothetical protein